MISLSDYLYNGSKSCNKHYKSNSIHFNNHPNFLRYTSNNSDITEMNQSFHLSYPLNLLHNKESIKQNM